MSNKRDEIKTRASSLVSGFIAPQIEDTTPTKNDTIEIIKEKTAPKTKRASSNNDANYDAKKTISTDKEGKVRTDKKGNVIYTKGNNYTITFKIDADIEDYLKNIEKIAFLESVKSGKINGTTRTEFVNALIRDEFYKLIGASDDDTPSDIQDKWLKYKSKNNL